MSERDDLLREQIAYYAARAPEYDEWFERRGLYDHGPEWNARWQEEVDEIALALDAFGPSGRILELACGTGWWTERLVRYGTEITAVDAAPETIELNRVRVGDDRVRYVVADLFAWESEGRYDVVFFSFWLSHVPQERFEEFWVLVGRALAPGGRVFFIDNLRTPDARGEQLRAQMQPEELEDGKVVRLLRDGTRFEIVKVYHDPAELEVRLRELGWDVEVHRTEDFFYYGHGTRVST